MIKEGIIRLLACKECELLMKFFKIMEGFWAWYSGSVLPGIGTETSHSAQIT